jgi:hypothetical protein
MRRSRHKTLKGEGLGQIIDTISIRERPADADDRAVPGHWEGDLLCGSNNSQIATLVEQHTRYVMLVRLQSKDTETVINALIKQARKLPGTCTNRSPGIAAARWQTTNASHWRPTSRFTSSIHNTLGNADRTRTPMAC